MVEIPYWPRLLSVKDAARYVGVSVNTFKSRIGDPWPEPIVMGRRVLFDRVALDHAVDNLSRRQATPKEGGESPSMDSDNDRLMHNEELEELLGLGRTAIYEMVRKGVLPAPLKIGGKAIRWRKSEIDEFLENCPRSTD